LVLQEVTVVQSQSLENTEDTGLVISSWGIKGVDAKCTSVQERKALFGNA
jgi:hypothetical protein